MKHSLLRTNLLLLASVVVLVVLMVLMFRPEPSRVRGSKPLVLFCAAGMRMPIEAIRQQFEEEVGIRIDVQYGGSNTLLSQLEISNMADLFLAADDIYVEQARERGLVREILPVARMVPVIIVQKDNPREIEGVDDLLKPGTRVALGSPDQAAVGSKTREALRRSR